MYWSLSGRKARRAGGRGGRCARGAPARVTEWRCEAISGMRRLPPRASMKSLAIGTRGYWSGRSAPNWHRHFPQIARAGRPTDQTPEWPSRPPESGRRRPVESAVRQSSLEIAVVVNVADQHFPPVGIVFRQEDSRTCSSKRFLERGPRHSERHEWRLFLVSAEARMGRWYGQNDRAIPGQAERGVQNSA